MGKRAEIQTTVTVRGVGSALELADLRDLVRATSRFPADTRVSVAVDHGDRPGDSGSVRLTVVGGAAASPSAVFRDVAGAPDGLDALRGGFAGVTEALVDSDPADIGGTPAHCNRCGGDFTLASINSHRCDLPRFDGSAGPDGLPR